MQGKMRKDLYKELFEVENYHWWHDHKRKVVHQMIKKYAQKGRVLDLGVGTGKILAELKAKGWQVSGVEGEKEALTWSKKRGITLKLLDIESQRLPFVKESFDLVLGLDVLEHVVNEKSVLAEIKRVLKPNGVLILTLPAYQWLFSYWDKMLGHQRRYTASTLRKKLAQAGLTIEHISYYCSLFLLPAVLVRIYKSLFTRQKQAVSDFKTTPLAYVSVPLLTLYTSLERKLLNFTSLPFGLSVIGVAYKKNEE